VYNLFLKSAIESGINPNDIHLHEYSIPYDHHGFGTDSWYFAIERKINFFTQELIKLKDGEVVLLMDCDIQFFPNLYILDDLVRKMDKLDVCFMRENHQNELNSGFMLVKKSTSIVNLFRAVCAELGKKERLPFGDQTVFNNIIIRQNLFKLRYVFIDTKNVIWGNNNNFNKKSVLFHHAVCCSTVDDKLWQLNNIRNEYNKKN